MSKTPYHIHGLFHVSKVDRQRVYGMRQAYQRVIPRQKPISVRSSKEEKGLFDIVDENSTYFVAKPIGIKSMPVKLI